MSTTTRGVRVHSERVKRRWGQIRMMGVGAGGASRFFLGISSCVALIYIDSLTSIGHER